MPKSIANPRPINPIKTLLSAKMQEWQNSDKISLMGKLMMYEAMLYWLWFVFVAIARPWFEPYVTHSVVLYLLLLCTAFIPTIWLMYQRVPTIRHNSAKLYRLQHIMLAVYSVFICIILWQLGAGSFVAGVSLTGGVMTAIFLTHRRLVWRMFWMQSIILVLLVILPLVWQEFPMLYHSSQYNNDLINNGVPNINRDTASMVASEQGKLMRPNHVLFWQITYFYFGMPKALALVFTVGRLLDTFYERREKIRIKANYDELTGVRNRRSLLEFALQGLSEGQNRTDHSMILVDLDHFKQVNDVHGHLVGDKILTEVAKIFSKGLQVAKSIQLIETSEIGRYGGEEFIILMPNTPQSRAIEVADQLRFTLASTTIDTGNHRQIVMTASFGVASLHKHCVEAIQAVFDQSIMMDKSLEREYHLGLLDVIEVVIGHADNALYHAKDLGRNRVVASTVVDMSKIKAILPKL